MDLSPEMRRELDRRLARLAAEEKDGAHEPLSSFDRALFGLLFFGSLAIIFFKIAGL